MNKHLVVIPAHNEEKTIYEVVTKALKYSDVSVTDDASRDRTPFLLKSILSECDLGRHAHQLNIITHPHTTHIAQSIQDGFAFARRCGYDFVVTMDAGFSHDPEALPDFMREEPQVDVVIGRRIKKQKVPWHRKIISVLANGVVNYVLTGSLLKMLRPDFKDCTSGYRRYSKRAYELIAGTDLKSKAFEFHVEAILLCHRSGMTMKEIPITYVFSNSSLDFNTLRQAVKYGVDLIRNKNAFKL